MSARRRSTPTARPPLALVAGLLLLGGCDAGGTVGLSTDPPLGPVAGAPLPARDVVGTWTRTVAFTDGSGGVSSSETVWTFAPDGVAVRLLVARNLTAGVADTMVTRGRWSVAGDLFEFRFDPPRTGSVAFRYRATATTLHLDELTFARR